MAEHNVMKCCNEKFKNECEPVGVCEQIRECAAGGTSITWLCLIRRNVAQLLDFDVHVKNFKTCFVLKVYNANNELRTHCLVSETRD